MKRRVRSAVESFSLDIGVAPFPHEWGKRTDAINRVPTLDRGAGGWTRSCGLKIKSGYKLAALLWLLFCIPTNCLNGIIGSLLLCQG